MSLILNAKGKNADNYTQTQVKAGFYTKQKEVHPYKTSQVVKTGLVLKSLGEKSCEIKCGGKEMARHKHFKILKLKTCKTNIFVVSSWPPLLISQLFLPVFKAWPVFTAQLFLRGYYIRQCLSYYFIIILVII